MGCSATEKKNFNVRRPFITNAFPVVWAGKLDYGLQMIMRCTESVLDSVHHTRGEVQPRGVLRVEPPPKFSNCNYFGRIYFEVVGSELRCYNVTKPTHAKKKEAQFRLAQSASSERYIRNKLTRKECDVILV